MGVAFTTQAQTTDLCQKGGGSFSINGVAGTAVIRGCAPFSVTMTNSVAGAKNIAYNFDYKGGENPTLTPNTQFIYTKPGKYRILQVGSKDGTGFTMCREVIVLDRTPPKAKVVACSGGNVKLIVEDDSITNQYDQIAIEWGDNSGATYLNPGAPRILDHTYTGKGTRLIQLTGVYFGGACSGSDPTGLTVQLSQTQLGSIMIDTVRRQTNGAVTVSFAGMAAIESQVLVKSGSGTYVATNVKSSKAGPQTLPLPSLDPQQSYCLKIRSKDVCGDSTESNEVCTLVLNAKAESERTELSWSPYAVAKGFVRYQLLRDGVVLANFTDRSVASYIDRDVACGTVYRYQILAITDQARSYSSFVEVTARSDVKPGVISQALVSVEQDGTVSLVAFPPAQGTSPTYKMIFERADSPTSAFKEVGVGVNTNRYSDATAATSQRSYCYRMSYENACGNRSQPSQPVCTIYLKKAGNAIQWTSDLPFTDAIGDYFVVKLNKGGAASEAGVGGSTTYDPQFDDPDEQQFDYQIRARSQNGAFLSYSNVTLFRREAALFLPDAFSPNGDGLNDVFKPSGSFYDNFQMIIYNRWGQSIYQTTDAVGGWDGTLRGEPAPPGQYVYRIVIVDSTGKEFVKTGTVLLLR